MRAEVKTAEVMICKAVTPPGLDTLRPSQIVALPVELAEHYIDVGYACLPPEDEQEILEARELFYGDARGAITAQSADNFAVDDDDE